MTGITYVMVSESRRVLGKLGRSFYGDPSAELFMIGITGTNGKTTVSYLLESILKTADCSVGVIGTINYRYGEKVFPAPNTTPESLELQRVLRNMATEGVTHVVMEVSSHAIDLGRIDDCHFDMGIFTNLSQEHLDYHSTMEDYYQVKKRFFEDTLHDRVIIVNSEDPWGRRLKKELKGEVRTFAVEGEADLTAPFFDLSMDGIRATLKSERGEYDINSRMIGRHNLSNIAASVAAAEDLGLASATVSEGIGKVRTVAGRLERVAGREGPAVFVDYAHTEDALRNVLESLLAFKKARIVTVFGCGGDRDSSKRPLMGKTATELSDFTFITSDNPRTEDPLSIIDDIERGIDVDVIQKVSPEEAARMRGGKAYTIIPDRKEAINAAVFAAGESDIILIAGKGHENYQIVGRKKLPFDDRIITENALIARGGP